MSLPRVRLVLLTAAVLLVGCDHATKHLAKQRLEHQGPAELLPRVFDLSYVENPDTGFGLLRAVPERVRTPALTAVQLLAGVAFLVLGLRRQASRATRAALLLIAAGALGNGLDRMFRGYVVDFLHLHHWPVFNLADVYITAGVILLLIAARFRPTQGNAGGNSGLAHAAQS
jgi:signal peptidase II